MKKTLFLSALVALVVSAVSFLSFSKFVKINNIQVTATESVHGASPVLYTKDFNGKFVEMNFTETAEDVLDAVVHIKSTQMASQNSAMQYGQMPDVFRDFFGDGFGDFFGQSGPGSYQPRVGTGSGVIIDTEGLIVTNNHVIADADDIEVTLHDNRIYKAEVIGTDPSTDLALLSIQEKNLPVVSLMNSDKVRVGEWVLAVGNPMGLNSTVTAGIISAKGRNINILKDRYAVENFIQTDAAINPGNSGGALVDLDGRLVGINTAIASPTGSFSGYGFAIPSNIVGKVIADLKEYGVVQRGVLGVFIRTIDGRLANELQLDFTQGVLVDSLVANSAAVEAGVKPGDIILEVEGVSVRSISELQGVIARYRPGETVNLLVSRSGEMLTKSVSLNNTDGNKDLTSRERNNLMNLLGADLLEITDDLAAKMDIDGGVQVQRLYPGKLAKYTQIQEGFVITKIDGEPIRSVEQMIDLLESKDGGIMLEGRYPDIPGEYYYAFGL